MCLKQTITYFCQNAVKMQSKCSQNSVKIHKILGVLIDWKVFSLVSSRGIRSGEISVFVLIFVVIFFREKFDKFRAGFLGNAWFLAWIDLIQDFEF